MLHTTCLRAPKVWSVLFKRPVIRPRWFILGIPRMASTLPNLPVFQAISRHDPSSTAVIHSGSGRRFTYGQLLSDVAKAKDRLRSADGKEAPEGERIAFIIENSYDYVGTLNENPKINIYKYSYDPSNSIIYYGRALYCFAPVTSISASRITICHGS